MFANLKIYLILSAIIGLLIIGFVSYYKISKAEIAALIEKNSKLETAVKLNEQTIDFMKKDAERLAKANVNLSNSMIETEKAAFERLKSIDELDLINSSIKNPAEVEKKINDEYKNFNNILERISSSDKLQHN
jgi:hypothetical protein